MKTKLNFIDLFAGLGGFDLSLHALEHNVFLLINLNL